MSDRIATNPFCTRFFQPGSIPFFFHPPMSLDSLVRRIADAPRGAIVGPHGSGKSTLLEHVTQHPALSSSFVAIHKLRFQTGEPLRHRWSTIRDALNSLSRKASQATHENERFHRSSLGQEKNLLIIDGWEQMDTVLQWFTRKRAGAWGVQILATSHTLPVHFTEIWRTRIDEKIEQHVLGYMLRDAGSVDTTAVTQSQAWHQSRQRHGQNLRESLFDMYDWYRDQVDVETTSG